MATGTSPRERILETASRLFYEQGYHLTGINQIIEEADVAKATFYSHFSTKQELGLAWLQRCRADFAEFAKSILNSQLPPLEKILRFFEQDKEAFSENYRGCPFLNVASEIPVFDEPMRQEVLAHKQNVLEEITRLVARYASSRVAPLKTPPEDTAKTIYLLSEAAIAQAQVFGGTWPFKAARDAALKALE